MSEAMSQVDLGDKKDTISSQVLPVSEDEKAEHHAIANQKEESKPQDPLLTPSTPQSPLDSTTLSSASSSPLKTTFTGHTVDEEKQTDKPKKKKKSLEQKKNILDVAQRICSLILSIIILTVMSHAYVVFRQNQDVTHDGMRIYPTFMQLWPTYMMITAGAMEVALNLAIVIWRIHGTTRDLYLITTSQKYWDYATHGISFAIWVASSTSFHITKNWGPAADPNVLWGYTCSPTATELSKSYPEIVRFWVQCEVQTVSFWMSVSAYIVEGFAIITKFFFR